MPQVFVVHHNPTRGRYAYAADPTDAQASAQALVDAGEARWSAGSYRRRIGVGDLLLFKFGGARLQHAPGVYAAAWVTAAPHPDGQGKWWLRFTPDRRLTRRLRSRPIVGAALERLVPRSFGASLQAVRPEASDEALAWLQARPKAESLANADVTHGLLIRRDPLQKILAGTKTWEIRGKATARRGRIALIESKSGRVVGTCELVDVVGPLTLRQLRQHVDRTGFWPDEPPYEQTYAWVLRDARRLPVPIPYDHPSGAVIWVQLEPHVRRQLRR